MSSKVREEEGADMVSYEAKNHSMERERAECLQEKVTDKGSLKRMESRYCVFDWDKDECYYSRGGTQFMGRATCGLVL